MTTLVNELKSEHAKIATVLEKVSNLGIFTPAAQKMLLEAKDRLLSHLKKEDERLYPVLRKEAENNSELKRTIDHFAKDMEAISQAALDFFDKYAKGGSGFEFAKDFGRLFSNLANRIYREESILYQKYNEIMEK